ncbi:CIR protein PIR protein [Plasmodium vinckei brucechwatti]|uniref:CIR protein PIR protein n=1 Tax=Plasmodium vinckei brucechwatti TaxID=119398 RepID=A0A6V7SVM0_PLAVN|nr:CIR protein PIR protein [Plasmodium vinckei brucechwatti]
MAKPSYNIEAVYGDINTIDGYFYEKSDKSEFTHGSISKYCPYNSTFNSGFCMNYFQMARSGVINLLDNLKKYNLEYDKLAEYAILFLSYKLKQHSEHKSTNLNTFYTKYIVNNNDDYSKNIKFNGLTCKDIIDKKKNLMNTNEISKFNEAFSILVLLYNEIIKNKTSCEKCSEKANDFSKNFENLNEDSNINGNTSYRNLLSTLSNDYDNFKSYYAEKCSGCKDIPTLPKVKTPPSKLIPALSTFSVIPVFLGIAYKTIFKKKIKKNKEENEN